MTALRLTRKTPSYLLDENWSKHIPNPAEPECTVSIYQRYANVYQTEPIEGTIAITVNDFAQYSLEWCVDMDWSANRAASTVVRWDGDQKALDAVRKLVAAGVRKAVTEANNGGRSQRASDWAEWGADWRTWRRGR